MSPLRRPATFAFVERTALDPQQAWRRVVDVSRHGEVVPMTRGVGPTPERARVGDRLVARTSLGPWGFDDVMIIRDLVPAESVAFEKVGRVLSGRVEVTCSPCEGGCALRWRQSVGFPFLPERLGRVAAVVVAPVLGRGYHHVVRRLLAPG